MCIMHIKAPTIVISMTYRFREKSVCADNVYFDESELDSDFSVNHM